MGILRYIGWLVSTVFVCVKFDQIRARLALPQLVQPNMTQDSEEPGVCAQGEGSSARLVSQKPFLGNFRGGILPK